MMFSILEDDIEAQQAETETYWVLRPRYIWPVVQDANSLNCVGWMYLFCVPQKVDDTWKVPSNFNRLSRLFIVLCLLLSIALRVWWPLIAMLVIVVVGLCAGYTINVMQRRAEREAAAEESLRTCSPFWSDESEQDESEKALSSLAKAVEQNDDDDDVSLVAASQFLEPVFEPTLIVEQGKSNSHDLAEFMAQSYVPNEFNANHNPPVYD